MDEARWDLFFRIGMEAYQNNDWAQAAQAFEVTVEEAASLQPPDLRLARSLNNLACALGYLDRPNESIGLQEQALALTRQLLGEDHELVAASYLNLASDYLKVQRIREAEQLFQGALERLQSPERVDLRIQALENFSQFYLAQERLPEAAQVMETLKPLLDERPESRAQLLHSLAHVYDALGQIEAADAARAEVMALIEKMWGPTTLAYAEVVANMAESLMAQGRQAESAEYFGKAADSFEMCVPTEDPRRVGSRIGQLVGLRDSGQWDAAAALGAKILDEPNFPEQRRWMNEHGLTLFLQQRYAEAAELFTRSLSLSSDLTMPARISIMFNLGSAHMGRGAHDDAILVLESATDLAEEHLQLNHSMTWRLWLQLQELYRLTDQPEKAQAIQVKLDRHTTQ